MKILIVNLHSSLNMGDLAITTQTLKQLDSIFPGSEITLTMNDPFHHNVIANEKAIGSIRSWMWCVDENGRQKWRPWLFPYYLLTTLVALATFKLRGQACWIDHRPAHRELLQAYFEADCVISCGGGNIFYTWNWHGFGFLCSMYALIYAMLLGKPVYMLPQSIGPFAHRLHQWLAGAVLKRMRVIIVREPRALAAVVSMGIETARCHVVPDLALGLEPQNIDRARGLLDRAGIDCQSGMPLVGINMMNWGRLNRHFERQAQYESALIKLMQYVVNELNGTVVLFPQVYGPSVDEDDRLVAYRLHEAANLGNRSVVFTERLSPEVLAAVYHQVDFYIGTRMHSIILAAVGSVPVISIGYMAKTWGTMQVLTLSDWICDIKLVDAGNLLELFKQGWLQREQLQRQLAGVIPDVRQMTWQAGELIRKDWSQFAQQRSARP